MDPDQALDSARKALSALLATLEHEMTTPRNARLVDSAQGLADAFEALDGWLSKGGFLPAAWAKR